MWFAVTQQNALAAPSLQGLGVSQPLTAELVLEWGEMWRGLPSPSVSPADIHPHNLDSSCLLG